MATTGNEIDRVLHIRFERSDIDSIEETLQAIEAEDSPETYFETTFHDADQLHQVTRPNNLELLRTIAREGPSSIRDAARLVDRDVRQVHENLNELESLGLIDLKEDGRSKRPTVWYDAIEVDLPLVDA